MDEPQSSQDGVPKSKFTYRHLNLLSSSTPPKENPLRSLLPRRSTIDFADAWF